MSKLVQTLFISLALFLAACSSSPAPAEAKSAIPKEVPTYLIGAYQDENAVKAALTNAGFEVITSFKVDKKGKAVSIVYTNDALKAAASKTQRGFIANLRILVDSINKQISIQNPVYFGKSFLQKEFDFETFNAIKIDLEKAFPALKPSVDKNDYDELEGYRFMIGMPYYEDAITLAEGNTETLLEKAQSYKKGKLLVFEQKLSNGSYLIGYSLGRKTSKFVKKIGMQNAALLPYTILIEDGKAMILDPKYYIAMSYPLLSMSEFMTIATVPGAIEKDLKKPFK